MADSRELTFGMDFGLGDAIGKLEDIVSRLESVTEEARRAEDVGRDIGSGIRAGTDAGSAGVDDLTDSIRNAGDTADDAGDDIGTNFRQMGAEAESFGQSIAKSMGTALNEGSSTAKSIKAGFEGAISYTQKKFTSFTTSFKNGAKAIGTAITHPVKTIKDKLGAALLEAGAHTDELGDDADETRRDLDEMGDAGSDAGGQIKDAIKGALGAFLGIEAIKAGIEALKGFVSAALEAAGAAENTSAKFDACFAGTDAADWVENYSTAIHRSKAEVESFMVSNKAMYGELGITGEAATELSKVTTSLAYDFGNAFSMSDEDALSVVQDYINGNSAALEEYGLHIDEAALKNLAMEMGLGSQIDELDDAAMAQVRMNALLGKSDKIQQAATNSTGGLVNSTKSLNGIWGDFMADAGAKFAPTLESLFGVILEAWPTIEPMLMNFVDILSNGMEQAAPILIELGQTLIPVLTSVLGTLLETATPLLSIFGQLAQTILPPVASIIGLIAETVMPPLVNILFTLNTAIIQPLVPVIQRLTEALLPPIAQLLGVISHILGALSPVLGVIGDVLGVIGDVLGTVIGWLADGVGKVVDFFSGLFVGAKDSKTEVFELGDSISDLGAATENVKSPEINIPQPVMPEVPPITVPVETAPIQVSDFGTDVEPITIPVTAETPEITLPSVEPVNVPVVAETPTIPVPAVESITIPVTAEVPTISAPAVETVNIPVSVDTPIVPTPEIPNLDPIILGAADTARFTKSIAQATTEATQAAQKAAEGTRVHYSAELDKIGTAAAQTHTGIAAAAESAWARMTSAAEAGATKIVGAFQRMATAAQSVGSANISIGTSIPHNASGTDNFEGGPTYMNEEGGEIAVLPRGSTIIPADKSERLVNSMGNSQSNNSRSVSISPSIQITVQGGADDSALEKMKAQLETVFRDLYKTAQEEDYTNRAIQQGYT